MMLRASLFAVLVLVASTVSAETTVTLSKMHLCCGACVTAVQKAVATVPGASVACSQDDGTAKITAPDDATAQKVVDAMAAAGFHGTSDHATIKVADDSGVAAGKVTRLELVGLHNCCGSCNVAIKKAIAAVDGVVADTAKAKQPTVVIEGNFDGQAVVQSLLAAGFHVKKKQ